MSGEPEDSAILLRTGDHVRASLVREILAGAGIPVSTPGFEHRSLLGVLGGYIDIVVRVPVRDLERARDLVAALEHPGEEPALARDDDPAAVSYRDSTRGAAREPERETRLKRVATFVAFVLPGSGHVYARQWRGGALLLLLAIAAFAAALAGVTGAIVLVPLIVLADIAGATWHCDRITTGVDPAGPLRRFAPELSIVLVAGWIALALVGPLDGWIAGEEARAICSWNAECSPVDERECLHDEARARLNGREPTEECTTCLGAVRSCDDFALCSMCWE